MSDIYLYNDEMWRVKYKFTYTGEKEEFRLPEGRYLCICKGAVGGTTNNYFRNKGGCSYGILNLSSPLKAYAVVGGEGGEGSMDSPGTGGFNGGGNGGHSAKQGTYRHGAGGGGASDIRLNDDETEVIEELPNPDYPESGKLLPEEYQLVSYIQSSAKGAYVNTGVRLAIGMRIEIDFQYTSSGGDDWFAGACSDWGSYGIEGGVYGGSLYTDAGFTYSQSNYLKKFTATALINTERLANTPSIFTVFARNNDNSVSGYCLGKCFGLRIWQDDEMIHNFIPCYRKSDNVVGMFDVIDAEFIVNSGSQSFISGDIITPTIVKSYGPKTLLSRIMVAGGGGGQGSQNGGHNDYADFTGYGGGVNGGYPYTKSSLPHNHEPSTQTSGYSFGKGEDGVDRNQASSGSTYSLEGLAGAGGGWYGGFASNVTSTSESYSCSNAGGGSGYILTESSYKPEKYMYEITPREDLNFSDTLMTAGLSNESCVIICESINVYSSGDRLICDCIGSGTQFPLYGGKYKIMCSGGQGAHRTKTANARKGGYAEGVLNNPDLITAYAYVGGSSLYTTSSKGAEFIQTTHPTISFNGGGQPGGFASVQQTATAGGGGTDLRIGTDSLLARVIVAGGAGGNGRFNSYGGAGGGETGGTHVATGYGTNYGPGKQNAAGSGSTASISGGFGYGGNGIVANDGYGGAGGGGWYGGSGTYPNGSSDDDYGGDGGSGYVLTSESFKPDGYLLGEEYYLTDTVLTTGGQDQLFPAPITGLVIEVIFASTATMLVHDSDGYKYYDKENKTWTYLKSDDITLEDFDEYGVYSFDNDTGLKDSYDIYVYDEHDTSNKMKFNVLPPPGDIKFRYHTEHTLTRYNIDADIDESAIDFDVGIDRKGIAEDAYLYFDFKYNLHDIPKETTRVYCIQGFTQGASIEYHEHKKKEKTLEHIDLLPVGSSTRMPARFKNYIGSFINRSEAITTINSAVVCEHNRCIYSVTLCNDSVVRFAKLNLVNNTSTVIKDIPKTQIGNTYYGDIKVDDDYIYITSSNNDNAWSIWRTPNSADTTVNTFSMPNDDYHRIQAAGRMEWYDNRTLMLMMRKGLALFDTKTGVFSYRMFADGTQNGARRDYACGKKKVLSLYNANSNDAYVIDLETNACEVMSTTYGQNWAGKYLNNACYHDGIFYVVQRNRLHYLDEETMTITFSIATPFTDIDPKQIVYGNGILYILMQNKPTLYMYDISTQTFYATGLPFKVDNWASNGWIRMCAFRGYCFIPQIRLYTINFVDRAKYNMGYKYDQFVIIMNKETSEVEDNQYEYDDRFVTFTDDNMQIHAGDIVADMIEVDSTNHIKLVSMTKDQYNKIIKTSFTKVEDDESEGP